MFLESPNGEISSVLRELYTNIYFNKFDAENIKAAIQRLIALGETLGETDAFLKLKYFKSAAKNLILIFHSQEQDNSDLVIDLDIWLSLATEVYANCFELFDAYGDLKIVKLSTELVVKDSKLIHKQEYIKAAEEYAAGRGKKKEFLNEWLKQVKLIPENLPNVGDKKQDGLENGDLSSKQQTQKSATQMQVRYMENTEQHSEESNDTKTNSKRTKEPSSNGGKIHNSEPVVSENSEKEDRHYNSRARKTEGIKSMFAGIRKVLSKGWDAACGRNEDEDTEE